MTVFSKICGDDSVLIIEEYYFSWKEGLKSLKIIFSLRIQVFVESQSGSDFAKTHLAYDIQPQTPGYFNTETILKTSSLNLYNKMSGWLHR